MEVGESDLTSWYRSKFVGDGVAPSSPFCVWTFGSSREWFPVTMSLLKVRVQCNRTRVSPLYAQGGTLPSPEFRNTRPIRDVLALLGRTSLPLA